MNHPKLVWPIISILLNQIHCPVLEIVQLLKYCAHQTMKNLWKPQVKIISFLMILLMMKLTVTLVILHSTINIFWLVWYPTVNYFLNHLKLFAVIISYIIQWIFKKVYVMFVIMKIKKPNVMYLVIIYIVKQKIYLSALCVESNLTIWMNLPITNKKCIMLD